MAVRRGSERIVEIFVALGSLAGLAIGAVGVWGTLVIIEPCTGAAAASAAGSVPSGYCSTIGSSLLIGLYLMAIGVVCLLSLIAQVRRV